MLIKLLTCENSNSKPSSCNREQQTVLSFPSFPPGSLESWHVLSSGISQRLKRKYTQLGWLLPQCHPHFWDFLLQFTVSLAVPNSSHNASQSGHNDFLLSSSSPSPDTGNECPEGHHCERTVLSLLLATPVPLHSYLLYFVQSSLTERVCVLQAIPPSSKPEVFHFIIFKCLV